MHWVGFSFQNYYFCASGQDFCLCRLEGVTTHKVGTLIEI